MTDLTPDEVRARAIIAGVFDPDQEHIDTAWEDLAQGTRDEWQKMGLTERIREAYADLSREQLESRLAFEWRRGVEKDVKAKAWAAQNRADKHRVAQEATQHAASALAAMQHVIELHRQGRKTVKVADLIEIYQEVAADEP